jgi:hypothetical protein
MKLAERFRMALAAALLAGTTCAAPAFADEGEETPGMVTLTFMSMGKEVDTKEVSEDGLVGELPSVSESGYNFIGWFDASGQQIFDDTLVDELAGTTITAEWSAPITYRITYKDGSNVIQGLHPDTYNVTDETVVLPTDAPKSGCVFKGWYDNIGLAGDPIEQFDARDCEDKVFYARFEPSYPLWIGGVRFTAGNLVIDADDDPGIASGTATYDPASNTLWLTNFVYSGAGLPTNRNHYALYYEAHSPDFVIDVSGTNRLAQVGADEGGHSNGLHFEGDHGQDPTTVTIRSADGGRLSVAADAASYSCGIYAYYADLVIDGAAVSAVGGPGLYHSYGAYFSWCSLTIESGSFAAQGGKATNYNSGGVSLGSTRESLFVKGGSLIATGGEGGWGSYGILGWGSSNPTPLSFTGGETLAQGGTAGIVDASLSVADGLAVFAGADADGAAAVEGDGWKNQKCVRIAAAPPAVAATVTFNNGNGAVAYDGQGHGVEVAVTDPAEGAAVLFALGDSSGPTNTFSATAPMFTNACGVTVYVEISAEGYTTITNHADVVISPATLVVSAKDQTYPYDGRPHGEPDPVYADPADIAAKVDVAGLVAGDTLASIVLTGQRTEPGTEWIVPYGATVTNATGVVTFNYAVGYANGTLTIEEPPPPGVSNVVARQRWPWNGLVDVDYEVGGYTEGLEVRISFAKQGDEGRPRVATRFLAGTEPSAVPGRHRATWDAKADGATNVIAEAVTATVELVREE